MDAGVMGNVNDADDFYDHKIVVIDPREVNGQAVEGRDKISSNGDKESIDEDDDTESTTSRDADMTSTSRDLDEEGDDSKKENSFEDGDVSDEESKGDLKDNSASSSRNGFREEGDNHGVEEDVSRSDAQGVETSSGSSVSADRGDVEEEAYRGEVQDVAGSSTCNGNADESEEDAESSLRRKEEQGKCLLQDFLEKSNNAEAEARLAARRQARAEAREIRMRELERQQKEIEENKGYDSLSDCGSRTPRPAPAPVGRLGAGGTNSYQSSRRSSEDSLEEGMSLRDIRHELKELEDKFRKAMIQNAQLDNEKASCSYQVDLLKDRIEDLEESHSQLQREHRDRCREHDQLKRLSTKLKEDLEWYKSQLEERDRLIQEKGLMIVGEDVVSSEDEVEVNGDVYDNSSSKKTPKKALVSIESAELLQNAGGGSLDVQLRRFAEERNELLDQIRHLKLELEEERSRHKTDNRKIYGAVNGSDTCDVEDVQREINKTIGEYKFKLQKAEQDVSTLQAIVARLESQVIRYKSAAESAEKVEDELKVEKRKLQRELRESQARVEELELSNSHLQRRLDKLKNAKSTLLKELN